MHSELSSLSNSKSKCCSIQYLFCKELETLIFTNTFIGFSKNRVKWLTSSSVVTGCIRRYCKCSYIYLGITHREFWLLYPNHALSFSIDSVLTEGIHIYIKKKKRPYPDIRYLFFSLFADHKCICLLLGVKH